VVSQAGAVRNALFLATFSPQNQGDPVIFSDLVRFYVRLQAAIYCYWALTFTTLLGFYLRTFGTIDAFLHMRGSFAEIFEAAFS
jgi:hypothetical protein